MVYHTNIGVGTLLEFRDNARREMQYYKISMSEVMFTVANPENKYKNRTGRLTIYEAHPKGRLIKVSVDSYRPRWVVSVRDFR